MALSPGDPNSSARPDLAIVTHTYLDVIVDFDRKVLNGRVVLEVEKKQKTDEVILDIRGLLIIAVLNAIDGSSLNYTEEEVPKFGSKLTIKLPETACANEDGIERYKINIQYETSAKSTALQWLTPEQTAGGKHPYLFSQCQAIHARSMLPCQDTPSVKSTYSARIKAPTELTVLMSALRSGTEPSGFMKAHKFNQPIPIPSYLIALAVGALVSKDIGKRSKVWAEAEYVDSSAYEFAETENMLKVAEDICGPYVWGIYDLLILPPSFPFGGMENPCLTFLTPTLLAGDRSLATVVSHEISHSWTGNLVTNANFEHFWLNEGFTTFVERKINGRLLGEKVRQFQSLEGVHTLEEGVKTMGETSQLTNLVPNLEGVDPDDSFSSVPYEKGYTFLYYLEELLGGSEKFEAFLRAYLDKFKNKSITTEDWKRFLYEYFSDKKELLDTVDWESWLHKPGMPPVIPNYDRTLANACVDLARRWLAWNESDPIPFVKGDFDDLNPGQKHLFLTELFVSESTLSLGKLQKLGEIYNVDGYKNAEIRTVWLRLCIKCRWTDKVEDALTFATDQGRMKYVRPIFREIYNWPEMRQRAVDKYLEKKQKMMYVLAYTLAKDLHLEE